MDLNIKVKSAPTGIIIPPKNLRKTIDTAAQYVAENGSTFEELLFKAQGRDKKFSFLRKEDPYHNYY